MLVFCSAVITSVSVTSTATSGKAGGPSINLTCTAIIVGTGNPMFTWFRPGSISNTMTGHSMGSHFINTLNLGRLKQSYTGNYTCQVTIGTFITNSSLTISIHGKWYTLY